VPPQRGEQKSFCGFFFFSAASLWEISIKARLGRTDFPYDPDQISQAAVQTGFSELPVRSAAAVRVATLPDHHRDPFDRLLIAQAMSEPAQFYTADPALRRYSELVTLIRPRGLGLD
jgi:PIN domain nuclease of toxin-antitoxin system